MPPAIRIFVLVPELREGQDRVLVEGRAERGAFQIAIFDVNVIVKLGVVRATNHGKEQDILIVNSRVGDFKPKLDGVFAGPLLERRRVESNIALFCVEMRRHVLIVASDAIENLIGVSQRANDIVPLARHFKEDIFKRLFTSDLQSSAKLAHIGETVLVELV